MIAIISFFPTLALLGKNNASRMSWFTVARETGYWNHLAVATRNILTCVNGRKEVRKRHRNLWSPCVLGSSSTFSSIPHFVCPDSVKLIEVTKKLKFKCHVRVAIFSGFTTWFLKAETFPFKNYIKKQNNPERMIILWKNQLLKSV